MNRAAENMKSVEISKSSFLAGFLLFSNIAPIITNPANVIDIWIKFIFVVFNAEEIRTDKKINQ